jgi:hypothetical protein
MASKKGWVGHFRRTKYAPPLELACNVLYLYISWGE